MRKITLISIILQLLYLNPRVESLIGEKVIPARYGEFPYVASLQHYPGGEKFCTGTYVSKKYVLTVAHCILDKTPRGIRVLFEVADLPSATVTAHRVASWVTYDDWADSRGIQRKPGTHDIAVIKLVDKVYEPKVIPVRLSALHHKQIKGKSAVVTGWNRYELVKGSVKILSDEDCLRNIRLITDRRIEISSRFLCTAAEPKVLLEMGDDGTPLFGDNSTLLGMNIASGPTAKHTFANYSEEFLQQYQVNLHYSVNYYWHFIVSNTEYH